MQDVTLSHHNFLHQKNNKPLRRILLYVKDNHCILESRKNNLPYLPEQTLSLETDPSKQPGAWEKGGPTLDALRCLQERLPISEGLSNVVDVDVVVFCW